MARSALIDAAPGATARTAARTTARRRQALLALLGLALLRGTAIVARRRAE